MFFQFLSVLALSWTVIYLLVYLVSNRSYPLLPSSGSNRRRRNLIAPSTQVQVNYVHLKIQTTAWNASHDVLARRLASGAHKSARSLLIILYNVGSLAAVCGMAGALILLTWTCWRMSLPWWPQSTSLPSIGSSKRALSQIIARAPTITPIIPGVTVPLYHLPLISLSVFVSQIVHEAGHGVAAALESIPLLSTGISLLLIMPSAFVSLSSTAVASLSVSGRLRIIAAGPFHNIVFWSLLLVLSQFSPWVWPVGYIDISEHGRVVLAVDVESPLYTHLTPGALITRLDDMPLGSGATDVWASYLTTAHSPETTSGWCVGKQEFSDSPVSCCSFGDHSVDAVGLSCFTSLAAEYHCMDPASVLTSNTSARCSSEADCLDPAFSCVRPDSSAQLLRLTFQLSHAGLGIGDVHPQEEVILWSGPAREVWEQVQVGTLIPRWFFLPVWLPRGCGIFFEYLSMATLSLYLFNLLPLPFLDGAQLLTALLDLIFDLDDSQEVDLERGSVHSGNSHNNRHRVRAKHRIGKVISILTSVLCGICTLLAVINWR